MSTNYGISQSGGEINISGPTAVGPRARAEVNYAVPADLDGLRAQLDRLVEELVARTAELEKPEEVIESAKAASAEAEKPQPNKRTLVDLLVRVGAGVTSLTGLADAAHALRLAVGRIL